VNFIKILPAVIPRSTVKDMLTELHGGSSGGHLGTGFRQEAILKKWCRECNTCAASCSPQARNQGQMHQYNVGATFKRIAIDVAGPIPLSNQGNWYPLVTTDYFMKWQEAYAIPNQEAPTMLWTSSAVLAYHRRYTVTRAVTSNLVSTGNFTAPWSEQNVHHTPAPTVGW
jgi:hypothetical protein